MAQEQTMKAETAAKKLGILLAAAPESFREGPVTRTAFDELRTQPPAWLEDLRRDGPHPRPVVAQKLGVSISGLNRAGIDEPLTTAQVKELLQEMPEWLVRERATQAEVHAENARVKQQRAEKAAARAAQD
ncbi:DUF5997 family protein [Curtobacterium sp. C1]|uniref:Uncharacterized protein n=1 Tax=Curtobacterium citreum TaxID=2036 RepID=A0A850DVA5_9MICO|nr:MULTISPECIES: DUF5997 family protein [Curtobacterium]MCS5488479.1 DUF5997 family protein [Curtobacterium flaccumfaciens pv. basellae]MDK8174119.1 DUF5997 family protein [Curtobacterium citreum]NUU27393.1 hypothetical protein [Curtobacterium albidum]QKS15914.1 hypothetical protein HUN59_06480 [Curtobacterium sp. Csp2]UFU13190.1 DUF5997 family protein [Curtobacterium sp. C1]